MRRRDFLAGAATVATLRPRDVAAQPAALSFGSSTATVGLVTQIVRRLDLEKKYELKLDIKVLDPAATEKAVLLRQVDAGLFPVITAADLYDKAQEIVLFAPLLYMHTSLMVWQDSPAQGLGDLRGKRIGLLDKVSGAYRGMQVIAARAGMDFERDFQPVTGPPPALVTFLQRKQVDALAIHEPIATKLLAEGKFRVVLGLNDEWRKGGRGDWLFVCAGAHRDWLERNRPAARRLAAMLLEAMRALSRGPELIEAEAAFLGLKTREEIELAKQRMARIFPTEWNETVAAGAMEAVREAARLGQIKQVPPPEFLTVLR
jgi:ABC-type nitrate/sulfonate/bicarbonate transport system substrate-binding protein